MDLKSKIILIYGPTASGKSDFANSLQVYKDLKFLTARPLKKNYQKIRHHLYGFQSGKKKFFNWGMAKVSSKKNK